MGVAATLPELSEWTLLPKLRIQMSTGGESSKCMTDCRSVN